MAAVVRTVGMMLRETGQALDRLGCQLVGSPAYLEALSRHRAVMPLKGTVPKLSGHGFVAPSAAIIGDVTMGEYSSVWYGAVLRGDVNSIKIGEATNIQDGCIIHVAKHNVGNVSRPTTVGDRVTVGHNAVLHACTVEDDAFVGMGATIMDGAVIKANAMVAAGAVVTPNTTVPSGELWGGYPAKKLRDMTDAEKAFTHESASQYALLAGEHAVECGKGFEQLAEEMAQRADDSLMTEDYAAHLGIPMPTKKERYAKTNL
mmetsp:Transcript_22529/g.76608  ORF Transcript_22529/g.76608 Transcript_22529/m.76608 type:complete len:260 (+) Transcript_22529:141-920(+)